MYEMLPERLSLFGNYMNGFFDRAGSEHANRREVSVKADVLNHRLVGTVSYYDIRVQDVLRLDPTNVNFQIQNGAQQSKGVEIELTANPFTGLNLVAGYAWNNSEFTNADDGAGPAPRPQRPGPHPELLGQLPPPQGHLERAGRRLRRQRG